MDKLFVVIGQMHIERLSEIEFSTYKNITLWVRYLWRSMCVLVLILFNKTITMLQYLGWAHLTFIESYTKYVRFLPLCFDKDNLKMEILEP